ncbi:hypothetical protein VOLCADRAFT_98054 [Volvox carteri f. nagariensis]|uniref:Uncharacterized protein n=1 Tax=Volvox carteri f. nagariensis TaxID=3068 RepID=D8UEB6_VOLCA|nr:uncharacterized protein VOLCADRAFT_98054 [Volvox carteri f. nagariensis]EFJ41940.1 hypothetical protein VOLCADRAFT_98054 [Volvox carteri f. nagariensis]|eukprot:XP_002956977.1 hypothetical protein VOLCADRAFT_98054 [Volvox carteri f. nagariensis]
MRTVGSSRCSFRAAAFLALFAFQGLGWWAGQAYGGLGGSSGGNGTEQMGPEQRSKAESFGKAFEDYVVLGQDPVAIALRRLSITAIDAFETAVQNQIARSFYNALNDILFTYANDERNRFTITPSFSFEASLGTSGNLQAAMDRVLSLAQALGNRENAAALLRSATTARDQVIAALRRPHADGSSNVGGLFMQQSWQDEDMDGDGEPQGLGVAARLARMQGLASGAANANFFSAASG